MKEIADTGLLVGFLFRRDPVHSWALDAFRKHTPFYTCDAVLAEAASFCPDPNVILTLLLRADLILDPDFSLGGSLTEIAALAGKYADQPMDLADACLVRMSELHRNSRIWTVDVRDFSVYRRFGRERIPCVFPERQQE